MIDTIMPIAKHAWDIIMSYYKSDRLDVHGKRDENDVVTAADFAADTYIQEQLRGLFPDDQILTEETLHPITDRSGWVWIVDPLDGTNNFAQQKDEFCVMIGHCTNAIPDVGVVYFPVTQTFFVAQTWEGAWCIRDGQREAVHASSCASLDDARVMSSKSHTLPLYEAILSREGDMRVHKWSGQKLLVWPSRRCMGYSSCLVARGELDIQMCLHGRMWKRDTCAPQVIMQEAGALLTEVDGSPLDYTQDSPFRDRGHLTAVASLHPLLVEFLK